ncbi:MAG: ComEC/Rec2 family competence protein [Eubacterium sp.]|nr:ComEC/Rec2 family competence protein [Eubacterium sp.]
MKRPLMNMGVMFVLGELTYRLALDNLRYSAITVGIGIITTIICNRFVRTKCSDLLHFYFYLFMGISFVGGMIWGYGFYSDAGRILDEIYEKTEEGGSFEEATDEVNGISANLKGDLDFVGYVEKMDESTSGKRAYLKVGKNRLSIYVPYEDDKYVDLVEPGLYIEVKGKLNPVQVSSNPGSFDMERYYLGKGIKYQIKYTSIKLQEGEKKEIVNVLYKTRCRLSERIDGTFNEETAALLKTMMLGDKSELSSDTKLLFQRSGIAHILAISGLHVALIAGMLEGLLAFLRVKKKDAVLVVIILVFLYGVMTGMSEATERAVIMITISKLSFLLKRTADMPTSLVEALLIMVILNPDSLFSSGMLMSFSAVVGIITGEILGKKIVDRDSFSKYHKSKRGWLRKYSKGLITSFSVSLWMMPLVMLSYFEVPILAILLNLFLVPLLTVVVLSGLLATLLGALASTSVGSLGALGSILKFCSSASKWMCEELCSFYKWSCHMFLKMPHSVIVTGHAELWQLGLIYVLIIGAIVFLYMWIKKSREHERYIESNIGVGKANNELIEKTSREDFDMVKMRRRYKEILSVVFMYFLVSIAAIEFVKLYNNLQSEAVFLDVGQGDGAFIHLAGAKGGRNYIMDSGSSSNDKVGENVLIPALKYYGMEEIDCIFISHTDMDHVSGILYLLENMDSYGISVSNVVIAAGTEEDEVIRRIEAVCDKYPNEISLALLGEGDTVDDCFEVLYPEAEDFNEEHSGNDYSLVLRFRYDLDKSTEILYTGDIGMEVESKIVEEQENGTSCAEEKECVLDKGKTQDENRKMSGTRILKCPHHGSKYSSSEDFLRWYSPDVVVISCGEHNMYGHPSPEALDRLDETGATIYRTDHMGAVIIDLK